MRIDHHGRGHRVQRLHDLHARKRRLNLLGERVRVADCERRRKTLREVERVRNVHQGLAFEVRAPAASNASSDTTPDVQLNTIVAKRRGVGERSLYARGEFSLTHFAAFSFVAEREPSITS